MKTGHTPGPWENLGSIIVSDKVNAFGNFFVASVERGDEQGTDEDVANARLIAAAPDMLELLKEHLEELKISIEEIGPCDHSVNICICHLTRLAEQTDALIARIEGKEAKSA